MQATKRIAPRTFWLSFGNKQEFAGVIVVDLSEDEVTDLVDENELVDLPAGDAAERRRLILAAVAKTKRLKINPGLYAVDDRATAPSRPPRPACYP